MIKYVIAFCLLINLSLKAQLIDELVSSNWDVPVGVTFDNNGKMYVWEKSGKVYYMNGNTKTLLINISPEVNIHLDHGLNGFALDPNFLTNGYIYLYYVARQHYVQYYGTPQYNPNLGDASWFKVTIARITRYKVSFSNGNPTLINSSRKILVGETFSTGIPIVMDNHGVGSLVFGSDGTLLASIGDVAYAGSGYNTDVNFPWMQEAINLGIITSDQNISSYRSQYNGSLNGKILRIYPDTGNGVESNPFYNSASPRGIQSRIYAKGLRNPFRFSKIPNTGSTNPLDGDPGKFYVGDVGFNTKEEVSLLESPGQNFGWPFYEGFNVANFGYNNQTYAPANPTSPSLDYRSGTPRSNQHNVIITQGSPSFGGNSFTGASVIGGLVYTGSAYNGLLTGKYILGDYSSFVGALTFDANHQFTNYSAISTGSNPTCFAMNPVTGIIYYTSYLWNASGGVNQLRKITYDPLYNAPPKAAFTRTPSYGTTPLNVYFDASSSSDPEGSPLTYLWKFSDTPTQYTQNPLSRTITTSGSTPQAITVKLVVTDAAGKKDSTTSIVSMNNNPPEIISVSLDTVNVIDAAGGTKQFVMDVTDDQNIANLECNCDVVLVHNEHGHVLETFHTFTKTIDFSGMPCDSEKYYMKVNCSITDDYGLSVSYSKIIHPKCCKENWDLNNTEYNISDGFYEFKASQTIQSVNKLEGNSRGLYRAGSIMLNPGFSVNNGTVFEAQVGGCN